MGRPNPKIHLDNLVQNRMSKEEHSEFMRTVAAPASTAVRRRKKAMRELARDLLDGMVDKEDIIRAELEKRGIDATEAAAVLLAQLVRARSGDTEAARFLRDTSGQKPTENVAVGNLDEKPFETLDLTALTAEQLKSLIGDG